MDYQIDTSLINRCAKLLIESDLSIAFAESATAGRITAEFAMADEAKFLKGGLACYDATLKEKLLKVDPELIEKFTPESEEVTEAIAKGLQHLIEADIYVGCTGLTCPGGSETAEKPVGTMFLHGTHNGVTIFTDRTVCQGNPDEIVLQTVNRAAKLLLNYLEQER